MDLFILYQYFITAILAILLINFIINNILFKNSSKYRLPESFIDKNPLISILIPARNEEKNIKRCLNSLIKQDYANPEILVLDDNLTDSTYEIASEFSLKDKRIKLYRGKKLPKGWMGKSYACHQLSKYAKGEYLIFLDADTLHFPSSVSSSVACLVNNGLDAVSVFARQIMVSIHERMMVPMGNYFILSFLPFFTISKVRNEKFCVAIGQFMLFKKEVYRKIGGHKSIRNDILEDIKISR